MYKKHDMHEMYEKQGMNIDRGNSKSADGIRINKYLASCGVCSRREADKLIEQGAVTVNGIKAVSGMQISESDQVAVHGKLLAGAEKKAVLAYYKPLGVVCTAKDKHAKHTVSDQVKYPVRLTYAGRLDKDSEGLLIMTNDGELIDAMMRGANRHEKEYIVKVDKPLTEEVLIKLRSGVYLQELELTTRECVIEQCGPYTMKMILTQGINRQIRRMCRTVGYKVKSLKRIRIMTVNLANLKSGEYRELSEEEKRELYLACGLIPD